MRRWINEFLIYAERIGGRFYIPSDEPPPVFDPQIEDVSPETGSPFNETDFPEPDWTEPLVDEDEDEDEEFLGEEEEEEEEGFECRDPDDFDPKNLRKIFSTREEAEDYAGDIPVTTEVFRRCSDAFWQVAISY